MALFHKKPQTTLAPLYSLGQQKTVLLVGLGNIGKEYAMTRHNIGFMCADYLQEKFELSDWIQKKDQKCFFATGQVGESRVLLIKPTTFMNESGQAVRAVMDFYKIPSNEVIAIHDELDIPFGQIRVREGGGDAGHNGIKSLIQHIGESFGRIRVGIGANSQMEKADFVLSQFTKDEQEHIAPMKKEVAAITSEYLYGGALAAETRTFTV